MAEPKVNDDPSDDIYKIFDDAGLTSAKLFNTKVSAEKIVNKIRTDLHMKLRSRMVQREHQAFNRGVQKGKDGQSE